MRGVITVLLGGGRFLLPHFCLTFPFVLNRFGIPLILRRTPLRLEFIGCTSGFAGIARYTCLSVGLYWLVFSL